MNHASALPLLFVLTAVFTLGANRKLLLIFAIRDCGSNRAVALNVWARSSFQKGTFRVTAAPGGTSNMTPAHLGPSDAWS